MFPNWISSILQHSPADSAPWGREGGWTALLFPVPAGFEPSVQLGPAGEGQELQELPCHQGGPEILGRAKMYSLCKQILHLCFVLFYCRSDLGQLILTRVPL